MAAFKFARDDLLLIVFNNTWAFLCPLQVENDLFRVHRHFFVRESVVFRYMLSIPSGSTAATEGLSDDKPILLQNVKSTDFECMMWMFYNK